MGWRKSWGMFLLSCLEVITGEDMSGLSVCPMPMGGVSLLFISGPTIFPSFRPGARVSSRLHGTGSRQTPWESWGEGLGPSHLSFLSGWSLSVCGCLRTLGELVFSLTFPSTKASLSARAQRLYLQGKETQLCSMFVYFPSMPLILGGVPPSIRHILTPHPHPSKSTTNELQGIHIQKVLPSLQSNTMW